jgi:hypothetical protein
MQRLGCHGARVLKGIAFSDETQQCGKPHHKPTFLGRLKNRSVPVLSGHNPLFHMR